LLSVSSPVHDTSCQVPTMESAARATLTKELVAILRPLRPGRRLATMPSQWRGTSSAMALNTDLNPDFINVLAQGFILIWLCSLSDFVNYHLTGSSFLPITYRICCLYRKPANGARPGGYGYGGRARAGRTIPHTGARDEGTSPGSPDHACL
jgi:hypothetical protein